MVKKKNQHFKFLTESSESKWLSRQIVNVIFNFDRAFQRFRRFFPNCAFNDLINDRISIMHEIVGEMQENMPDMTILKRLLESILKIIWTIDKQMVNYMKQEREKEIKEEKEYKEEIKDKKEDQDDIKNQQISNKEEVMKDINEDNMRMKQ